MALSALISSVFGNQHVSNVSFRSSSFSRTTALEEPEEGTWQVSVVPAPADEVAAEHRPNTKVSAIV